MYRILIAEDNKAISNLIKTHLSFAGYETSQVYDGKFALELLEEEPFDLLILDLMLPKVSGVDILTKIKDYPMPIIVVTALDDLSSKVQCLQVGADDYITKPFDSMDLLARVGAVLRRCRRRPMAVTVRSVTVDPDLHRVLSQGKEIELTPKEFDLLYYLCSNCGKVLTRKEILSDVWGTAMNKDVSSAFWKAEEAWYRQWRYSCCWHSLTVWEAESSG